MKRNIHLTRSLLQQLFAQALMVAFSTIWIDSVANAPDSALLQCPTAIHDTAAENA